MEHGIETGSEGSMNGFNMGLGPKMAFILRVYRMSEAENAEDIEHDRQMVRAGVMSERTYDKRCCTRDLARRLRRRDDKGRWPRDDARPKYRGGPNVVDMDGRPVLILRRDMTGESK
jgi:hypothetical protein